jgi:hypothetical protein
MFYYKMHPKTYVRTIYRQKCKKLDSASSK